MLYTFLEALKAAICAAQGGYNEQSLSEKDALL